MSCTMKKKSTDNCFEDFQKTLIVKRRNCPKHDTNWWWTKSWVIKFQANMMVCVVSWSHSSPTTVISSLNIQSFHWINQKLERLGKVLELKLKECTEYNFVFRGSERRRKNGVTIQRGKFLGHNIHYFLSLISDFFCI